jgi:transposase
MKQKLELEWRRNKVLELSSQGYSEREIGNKLQISHITVHRDLMYLKKQAQENLQKHIHEVVPSEYQKCRTAMKLNLKDILEIGDKSADPRIKLEAKKIANETLRYIMELITGGVICTKVFGVVTQKQEQKKRRQRQTVSFNSNVNR